MRIVIDIPEETYKNTCDEKMLPPDVKNVVEAIKNGTPLRKGHGRLIDGSKLEQFVQLPDMDFNLLAIDIFEAPTIIEADEKGVLEQIAEEQQTLLDTTKAWSKALEHGDIY